MIILRIESVAGYRPRPDFQFSIDEDGMVRYTGRYYVAVIGNRTIKTTRTSLNKILNLAKELAGRNYKNYLKKNLHPIYTVRVGTSHSNAEFEVDENDVISEDLISQIIDLCGISEWISSDLDLFMVMSQPAIRSRELGIVRASNAEEAGNMYLKERPGQNYRSLQDFIVLCIGHQTPGAIESPLIYCSYTEYRIDNNAPKLYLNRGTPLHSKLQHVFFFVSFGKRYNDPTASYFMVLAQDLTQANNEFYRAYPHFMENDFQVVEPGIIYNPIPLFTAHIPIAIR
ncbi:hypothetical protein KUV50_04130 [Membranicola marinus]|uniref:DUF6438 domain-containing protein n=1 Tax=Membranihabitans marinus TaxID=1227546 RepID=A0A953L660_9BACT|nr:DUF6438 domain-containing protein [Membranihabitans marinus]MBY5957312.1 hypothetical protein [Membranihabitans marinus]